MRRESRALFGTTLIRAGLATKRQVDMALSIQRKRRDAGESHKRLGEIMIERGVITPDELSVAVAGDGRGGVKRFGDLCVRMGFIDEEQVAFALAEQKRLRKRGTFRRLGEILLEARQLEAAQLPAVLGAQGFEIAECSKCRVAYNVPPGAPPEAMVCSTCGRELIVVTAYDDDALLELELEGESEDSPKPAPKPTPPAAPNDVMSIPGARRPVSTSTAPLIIMPSPDVIDLDKKLKRAVAARRDAEKSAQELGDRIADVERARSAAAEEARGLRDRLDELEALGEELEARERELAELRSGLEETERARDDALDAVGAGEAEVGDARKELLLLRLEMEQKEAEITRTRSDTRRFTNETRRLSARVSELEHTVEHLEVVLELKDAYIKELESQCGVKRAPEDDS